MHLCSLQQCGVALALFSAAASAGRLLTSSESVRLWALGKVVLCPLFVSSASFLYLLFGLTANLCLVPRLLLLLLLLLQNPDPKAHEYFASHIAKAYAALTDEVSKENYKKYGHPDGHQVSRAEQTVCYQVGDG